MVFKKVIRTTKCGLRCQFAPKGTPRTYILLDRKCTFLARAFARAKKVHCTFRCNLSYVPVQKSFIEVCKLYNYQFYTVSEQSYLRTYVCRYLWTYVWFYIPIFNNFWFEKGWSPDNGFWQRACRTWDICWHLMIISTQNFIFPEYPLQINRNRF